MAIAPKYSYSPIESPEIRLFKFLKSDTEILSGTLQTFSLSPASQSPPAYTALSYVWSLDGTEPTKSGYISIDGMHLPVLDSLLPFFEVLQSKGILLDSGWWWIDSICINQEDIQEKSSQVGFMRAIYSRAGMTTVWLGDSSADSDKAMDFINVIWEAREKVEYSALVRGLQLEDYSSYWKALENLFQRRWWSRVWTIQEFILPRYLSFWCGLKTARRVEVAASLQPFHDCRPNKLHSCPAFVNSWSRYRVFEWHKKYSRPDLAQYFRMSLVALASSCSFNHATNKRDLLYSLCALTPDIQLLKIDYSLSEEDVYTEFTKSNIEHYKSLDIICFAHLHSSSIGSSLPTWVPDWRTRPYHHLITPLMVSQGSPGGIGNLRPRSAVKRDSPVARYMASGNTKPDPKYDGSNLVVRGFVLDVIDGLGGNEKCTLSQPSEALPASTKDSSKSSEWALHCLTSVLGCLIIDRADRYLQDAAIPKIVIADFLEFLLKAMQNKHSEIPADFKTWFDHNRLLRIRGHPLEEIIRYITLNNEWISEDENRIPVLDPQFDQSFAGRFYDTVVRMARRLMVSKKGLLGLAPEEARKGDIVCILFGCSVPVVLRKTIEGKQSGLTKFIGECYVDGYMSGEAVGNDSFQETNFRIC